MGKTVPPLSNSDHLGLFLAVTVSKPRSCPKRCGRRVWRYAFADFELAQELLEAVDWDLLLSSANVNDCLSKWQSKFLQVMESCIPQAIIKWVIKQDCTIPALQDDSVLTTSHAGKANLLNNYFYECFNHSFPSLSNLAPLDPSDCPASILCTKEFSAQKSSSEKWFVH